MNRRHHMSNIGNVGKNKNYKFKLQREFAFIDPTGFELQPRHSYPTALATELQMTFGSEK